MTRLEYGRYLQLLSTDGERLAHAASHLDAPVPPCPGWDVREAVRHTGSVYRNKVACMRLNRRPEDGEWNGEPAHHEDLVLWFRDSLELLLDELRSRKPEDATYTWWPPEQNAGFWARRMALETAVHRADVESASGAVTAVDRDLAIDGIDEVLQIFLVARGNVESEQDGGGTVAVSVDTATWTVLLRADGVSVQLGGDAHPDARLSGEPSALFLYLWGRGLADPLNRSGDVALVDALRARLAVATA